MSLRASKPRRGSAVAAVLLSLALTLTAGAADRAPSQERPVTPQERKFFEMHVRPVLVQQCFRCHGPNKQESGLRLDSPAAMLKGGDSGPAVVRGKPEESLLMEAIRHESFEMPPDKDKLPDKQIEAIATWIKMGIPWPADRIGVKPSAEEKIGDEDRAYWAYQPVQDPPVPAVKDGGWCRSEIDRFILARLQQEGLGPAAEAKPEVLVRRLYFDLVGLPPTPQELDAYLADTSAERYERLVDRLLDDPRYGEKWGRHWLDLVRYAESDGWRQDAFRPEAHKYRDYVVQSFNEDKPYDRFVTEQIAGDEVDPGNPDAITATALLRHGIYEYNQRDVETQWGNILDEIVDVTGDAFMGTGMACARCHDHKFDPILQDDYFRLRAFFEPIQWREDQPQASVEERTAYEEQLARWEAKTADIRRQLDSIEWPVLLETAGGQGFDKFAPELKAMMLKRPEDRTPYEEQIASLSLRQLTLDRKKLAEKLKGDKKKQWERLTAELAKFDDLKPKPLAKRRFAVSDVGPVAPPTYVGGNRDGETVEPGFLTVLKPGPAKIAPPPAVLHSTGRRTALAQWLTDPSNPLATRVIVNRVWQHHFGIGLVATSNDFGHLGEPPSHPALLDWLARRLVDDGWSFKRLHRRILTSAVYRQTSLRPMPEVAAKMDPDNRLLWRMNPRRLDAEQIRDAMLAVSGELDTRIGGPSVAASSTRRSIYVRAIRNTRPPMFDQFDMADGLGSTSERNVTTTPTQALLMINGPLVLSRAGAMANRLKRMHLESDEARVDAAYRLAYGRPPTDAERSTAVQFLRQQAAMADPAPEQSLDGLAVELMPQTGAKAVLLKPGSAQQRLQTDGGEKMPTGDFTVEAVVLLESIYPDATVRTIAAQWDSNSSHPGWALGVTSKKSAYTPRNLILQLVGNTAAGARKYEVIPSGIHLKLDTPYYVAVAVHVSDTSPKGVRFFVDDLSVANEPPQVAEVSHTVTSAYRGDFDFAIGGRDQSNGSYWDGLIDEVRLSRTALTDDQLFLNGGKSEPADVAGHWRFESDPGMLGDSSGNGLVLRTDKSAPQVASDPETTALVDFCHVILNSNEFLYID